MCRSLGKPETQLKQRKAECIGHDKESSQEEKDLRNPVSFKGHLNTLENKTKQTKTNQ